MKANSARPPSVLLLALALAAARPASATDGRYREYVVGERAAGMGGAALAVAADVDAIFYNPAGLARSKGDSLSLSANLYGLERYETKGGLEWGGDAESSSFVTVPAAMGGVKRYSDEWVGGFGAFTPKMEKRHLVSASPDRTGFNHMDYDDQTLWIGPAAAWAPAGSRFSFGAGLFAVYRDYSVSESTFKQNVYTLSGAEDLKALGVLATFGVQADLGGGWRAGATVQTPSLRVWDDGTLSVNGVENGAGGGSMGFHTTDVRADNYIPWQLAAGLAKSGENWCIAFDAIWHPSTHYDLARWNIDGFRAEQTIHLRSVLDASLGAEYVVADRYPVRAGVYTAMSAVRVPDDPESTDFTTSDVDMFGVTFSVGRRGQNMSVDFGVDVAFGSGHDLDYGKDGGKVRVDSDRCVVLATVSTTYYF
ncbi:MAG: hypothetical protein IJV65_03275 [Kiritimatiellae bacterium]|nr:hypothetical protein [Kiritimatiellia bacterium]